MGAIERAKDLLYGALRIIQRQVAGFFGALGLYFVLGLALSMLALAALVGLAELVDEGVVQPVDEAVLLWIARYRTPWLDVAALEVTALGSRLVVWITVLTASAFLWVWRGGRRRDRPGGER